MSRVEALQAVVVPARVIQQRTTRYNCDKCHAQLTRDDAEVSGLPNAHELIIVLDEEQCVNFFRRRDYCPECLEPVWAAINTLVGADPELERDRDYDD